MEKVKTMAWYNWEQYIKEGAGITTPGQVLWYPLNVSQDGTISPFDGISTFPDFGPNAKITGTVSTFIPQKVTT